MRHAGPEALARLDALLAAVRTVPDLRETRPGVFSLKGRPALHFHEDPTGLHADVRLAGTDFARMRVETPEEQDALLARLRGAPAS